MTMDVLTEVLKQVPALAVLGYIVIQFLKHLEMRDQLLKSIGAECHDVQRQTSDALLENARVMAEVRVLLKDMNGQRGE